MVDFSERPLDQDDIYIAVLGLTGTGKSTFVARCAGEPLPQSGHSLDSDTTSVTIHSFERNGPTVHLIDTPGFDDNRKDDATIMQELAFWLLQAHQTGFVLNGLVYLHRITDNHLQGSALRALNVFKAMCGPHCYPGVVLATTRWDEITGTAGHDRQRQLVNSPSFWGDIVTGGGTVMPLHWNNASALAILDALIASQHRLTLSIQTELSPPSPLALHETAAGQIVHEAYVRLQKQWETQIAQTSTELEAAVRTHHDRHQLECQAEIALLKQSVGAKRAALTALRTTGDQLLTTWMQRIASEMGVLATRASGNVEQVARLEEGRAKFAEDRRAWEMRAQNTGVVAGTDAEWMQARPEAVAQARREAKLSGQVFRHPEQVGAVAGVLGAYFGLGSLALAAQQAAVVGGGAATALGPAALLCIVM